MALSALATALHLAGMFPGYFTASGHSLAGQIDQAGLYAVVTATWAAVTAALAAAALRRRLWPFAAAMAVGVSAVEFGFRVADVGTAWQGGPGGIGAGLWLVTAGWVAGAAAAVVAVVQAQRQGSTLRTGWIPGRRLGISALLLFCGAASAVAFAPAWDEYEVTSGVTGQTAHVSAGNAFTGPAWFIVGNCLVILVLAGLPLLAAWWRSPTVGAAAVAAMIANFSAQFVAAALQAGEPVTPASLGIPAGEAQAERLRAGLHLTSWFASDVVAVFGLAVAAVVLAIRPRSDDARNVTMPLAMGPWWAPDPAPPWAGPATPPSPPADPWWGPDPPPGPAPRPPGGSWRPDEPPSG